MIPIDEQIRFVGPFITGIPHGEMFESILASLEELKRIREVQVPEEPVKDEYECYDHYVDSLKDYIDTLRDLLKRERTTVELHSNSVFVWAERAEAAEAKLAAAEENVSELMAEAFDRTLVAGGHAVSAAEDHSPQRVEAPHFKEWANKVYGDVRPCDIDRIEAAFTAGAEAAERQLAAMLKLGEEPSEEMMNIYRAAFISAARFDGAKVFQAMFSKLAEQAGVKK